MVIQKSEKNKGNKKIKLNSMFFRNFFIILALEMGILSMLSYSYTIKIHENARSEVLESNYNELKRSGDVLDTIIRQLGDCAYYIGNTAELKMMVLTSNQTERMDTIKPIMELMGNYRDVFHYVDNMSMYMESIDSVISSDGVRKLEWVTDSGWLNEYREIPYQRGEEVCHLMSRCKNGTYPFLLTILSPIYNGKKEKVGVVIIDLDIEELNHALGWTYQENKKLYMVSKEGDLLYSSISNAIKYPELIPDHLEGALNSFLSGNSAMEQWNTEEGDSIVSIVEAEKGGYYILFSPASYLEQSVHLLERFVGRNVVFMIGAGIILSLFLAYYAYHPIRHIMSEIREYESETEAEMLKANELEYIIRMIRNAKRKNDKFVMETNEWMQRLTRAQLLALQSQINPHFLYNTLDSINWMVMEKIGRDNNVSGSIRALAALFRMSVKSDSYLVSLEEELEHVRLYLELLNVRYQDKIKVHFELNEISMSTQVTRFCLQPIIENAVKHGLKTKRYQGEIYIRGDQINDTLVLRIEDNGIGMDRDECMRINRILSTEYHVIDEHVGIKNVNQRMKILFGENFGVQLRPREEGGLVVVMCFPAE